MAAMSRAVIAKKRADLAPIMSFTAKLNKTPEEIRDLLSRGLSRERGDSWASSDVLTSSTDRVYGKVTGNDFQASRHAGMTMLGAIATGRITDTSDGCIVHVAFRFGIAPAGFPLALLVFSAVVGLIGLMTAHESIVEAIAWLLVPATVSLYWSHTRSEVRVILEKLGEALGGVSWHGPPR